MAATPPASLRVAVTLEQCWHDVPGGTAVAALEVLHAFAARTPVPGQPDVELVGVAGRHRRPPPAPWNPPIPTHHLGVSGPVLYESWHRLRRPRVERATGPVDVIWATGIAMPPRTVPIVATLHDLAFRRPGARFTRQGMRFFEAALRLIARDADIVVCSSQATEADCVAAGLDPGRLRVVPLGVRPSPFTDEAEADAAVASVRAGFGIDRPYLVSVGTIEPRKNLQGLLVAYAELVEQRGPGRTPAADLDLVVVGPTGWSEDLDALVPAALQGRVHRTGFVSEADKRALLRGAVALAYPSLWEGFGLPVLEAMAEGTPVVTSAGTATEEAAGGAALLVDPRQPGAIAAAVARVATDRALAADLAEAGRARAAACAWGQTADGMRQAFVDAAASDGPGAIGGGS